MPASKNGAASNEIKLAYDKLLSSVTEYFNKQVVRNYKTHLAPDLHSESENRSKRDVLFNNIFTVFKINAETLKKKTK